MAISILRIYKLSKLLRLPPMMNEKSPPITLDEFLEKAGRQRFRKAIGRSEQLMTRAVRDGLMPSGWFIDVRNWCVTNKIDVPEHLFRWAKGSKCVSHSKQNVYQSDQFQGETSNVSS